DPALLHSAGRLVTVRAVVALLALRHRREARDGRLDRVVEIAARRRDGEAVVDLRSALRLEVVQDLHELRKVRGEVALLLLHGARVVDDEDDVHLLALVGLGILSGGLAADRAGVTADVAAAGRWSAGVWVEAF